LFAVDVLARLGGSDDGNRVPVVRCRDHDGVDIIAFEDFPEILIGITGRESAGGDLLAVMEIDKGLSRLASSESAIPVPATSTIDVAHGHDLNAVLLQEARNVIHAHVAGADEAQRDAFAGWWAAGAAKGGGGHESRESEATGDRNAGFEKFAASWTRHRTVGM